MEIQSFKILNGESGIHRSIHWVCMYTYETFMHSLSKPGFPSSWLAQNCRATSANNHGLGVTKYRSNLVTSGTFHIHEISESEKDRWHCKNVLSKIKREKSVAGLLKLTAQIFPTNGLMCVQLITSNVIQAVLNFCLWEEKLAKNSGSCLYPWHSFLPLSRLLVQKLPRWRYFYHPSLHVSKFSSILGDPLLLQGSGYGSESLLIFYCHFVCCWAAALTCMLDNFLACRHTAWRTLRLTEWLIEVMQLIGAKCVCHLPLSLVCSWRS